MPVTSCTQKLLHERQPLVPPALIMLCCDGFPVPVLPVCPLEWEPLKGISECPHPSPGTK